MSTYWLASPIYVYFSRYCSLIKSTYLLCRGFYQQVGGNVAPLGVCVKSCLAFQTLDKCALCVQSRQRTKQCWQDLGHGSFSAQSAGGRMEMFSLFSFNKKKSLGLTLKQFPNMNLQKYFSLNLLDSTSQRWISESSGPDGTRRKCFKSNVISWNQMCNMTWKMDSMISTLHLACFIF